MVNQFKFMETCPDFVLFSKFSAFVEILWKSYSYMSHVSIFYPSIARSWIAIDHTIQINVLTSFTTDILRFLNKFRIVWKWKMKSKSNLSSKRSNLPIVCLIHCQPSYNIPIQSITKKNTSTLSFNLSFFSYISGTAWATKLCLHLFAPFSKELSVATKKFQIWWQNQLIFAKTLICQ